MTNDKLFVQAFHNLMDESPSLALSVICGALVGAAQSLIPKNEDSKKAIVFPGSPAQRKITIHAVDDYQ